MLSLDELLLDKLDPILDKVLILLILRDDIGNNFGDVSERKQTMAVNPILPSQQFVDVSEM